jgi:hypothetical protein
MKRILLFLAVTLSLVPRSTVQAAAMIYNLAAPGPSGGIGDIHGIYPGYGNGVSFQTGADPYVINSVTLEHYNYHGPSSFFHVQVFQVESTPSGPVTLCGELGNSAIDPRPTQWPGSTTFVNYTPSSPIILTPNTSYLVAASESADSPTYDSLLFAYSISYAATPDWTLYPTAIHHMWRLTPLSGWPDSGHWALGGGPLKLEVDASPVPEPSVLAIVSACGAAWAVRKRRRAF